MATFLSPWPLVVLIAVLGAALVAAWRSVVRARRELADRDAQLRDAYEDLSAAQARLAHPRGPQRRGVCAACGADVVLTRAGAVNRRYHRPASCLEVQARAVRSEVQV